MNLQWREPLDLCSFPSGFLCFLQSRSPHWSVCADPPSSKYVLITSMIFSPFLLLHAFRTKRDDYIQCTFMEFHSPCFSALIFMKLPLDHETSSHHHRRRIMNGSSSRSVRQCSGNLSMWISYCLWVITKCVIPASLSMPLLDISSVKWNQPFLYTL